MSASPPSRGAAVTAIEAVYVPADDFTDPAVTAISSHLDSMIVLSRAMAAEGMYPAVDPLASSSILLDPTVVGEEHYRIAEEVRETIAHYRELQDIISLLGIEELSARDRLVVGARAPAAALPHPALRRDRGLHRHARTLRAARRDAQGCRAILDGDCDGWDESSLYMVGTIEDARDKDRAKQASARARMRLLITTPTAVVVDRRTSSPCAPRMRAAASASSRGTPIS